MYVGVTDVRRGAEELQLRSVLELGGVKIEFPVEGRGKGELCNAFHFG